MRDPGWVCLYGGGNPARVIKSRRHAHMSKAINMKGPKPSKRGSNTLRLEANSLIQGPRSSLHIEDNQFNFLPKEAGAPDIGTPTRHET